MPLMRPSATGTATSAANPRAYLSRKLFNSAQLFDCARLNDPAAGDPAAGDPAAVDPATKASAFNFRIPLRSWRARVWGNIGDNSKDKRVWRLQQQFQRRIHARNYLSPYSYLFVQDRIAVLRPTRQGSELDDPERPDLNSRPLKPVVTQSMGRWRPALPPRKRAPSTCGSPCCVRADPASHQAHPGLASGLPREKAPMTRS